MAIGTDLFRPPEKQVLFSMAIGNVELVLEFSQSFAQQQELKKQRIKVREE